MTLENLLEGYETLDLANQIVGLESKDIYNGYLEFEKLENNKSEYLNNTILKNLEKKLKNEIRLSKVFIKLIFEFEKLNNEDFILHKKEEIQCNYNELFHIYNDFKIHITEYQKHLVIKINNTLKEIQADLVNQCLLNNNIDLFIKDYFKDKLKDDIKYFYEIYFRKYINEMIKILDSNYFISEKIFAFNNLNNVIDEKFIISLTNEVIKVVYLKTDEICEHLKWAISAIITYEADTTMLEKNSISFIKKLISEFIDELNFTDCINKVVENIFIMINDELDKRFNIIYRAMLFSKKISEEEYLNKVKLYSKKINGICL